MSQTGLMLGQSTDMADSGQSLRFGGRTLVTQEKLARGRQGSRAKKKQIPETGTHSGQKSVRGQQIFSIFDR